MMLPPTSEWFQGLCERIATLRGWEWPAWLPAEKALYLNAKEEDLCGSGVRSLAVRPTPDFTDIFFAHTWPDLRLVIFTGGDWTVKPAEIAAFLERHPRCSVWGTNLVGPVHQRVRVLPLFLANRIFRGGGADLDPPVVCARSPTDERAIPVLCTWNWHTHPKREAWWIQICELNLPQRLHTYRYLAPDDYEEMLGQSQAVVCPPGNGFDTHRAWETLYKGGWPILFEGEHTQLLLAHYPDLPCLVVGGLEELATMTIPPCPSPWWPGLERPYWEALFSAATAAS